MTSYCTARLDDGICGAQTNAWLCKACLADLERALAETQSYRHEVSLLATKQTRVYRANANTDSELEQQRYEAAQAQLWEAERRAKEARIAPAFRSKADRVALPSTATMVNLGARDLLTECDNTITTWARVLHESVGLDWPGFTTVGQVLVWLVTNAEAIRWHEAAAEAHDQFTQLHRRMRRAVDRAPSRVYAGVCHAPLEDNTRCVAALFAIPGADEIVCDGWRPPVERTDVAPEPGCGAVHTSDERDAWLRVTLDESLLTYEEAVAMIARLFGKDHPEPSRDLLKSWVKSGRLTIRGTSSDGASPTYRGEELFGLIQNYRPHRYAPRPNRRTA